MNYTKILEWLTSLPFLTFMRAVSIITIFGLIIHIKALESRIEKRDSIITNYSENRRLDDIKRSDSINNVVRILVDDCNKKSEDFLKSQLSKLEESNNEANKILNNNYKLIKSIKNAK